MPRRLGRPGGSQLRLSAKILAERFLAPLGYAPFRERNDGAARQLVQARFSGRRFVAGWFTVRRRCRLRFLLNLEGITDAGNSLNRDLILQVIKLGAQPVDHLLEHRAVAAICPPNRGNQLIAGQHTPSVEHQRLKQARLKLC